MSEYYEHNPDDHEDPLAGPTWLLGVIGAVLLAVIVLGLTALYYNAQAEQIHEKAITREIRELRELREAQEARLTGSPRWERRMVGEDEREFFVIPIEQAMQQIAEEYGR